MLDAIDWDLSFRLHQLCRQVDAGQPKIIPVKRIAEVFSLQPSSKFLYWYSSTNSAIGSYIQQ
jgi:hypothetical protein